MVIGMMRMGRMGAGSGNGTVQPLSITAPRGYAGRDNQFPMSIANTISFADSEDDGSGVYTATITMLGGKQITRSGWTGSPGTVISRNGTLATINAELVSALDLPAYTSEYFDGNTVRLVRDADSAEVTRSFGVAAFAPLSSAAIDNDVADGTLLDTLLPDVPGMSVVINSYSATLDETAPVLSVPVSTETGETTGTIGATTDTGEGTMYAVLTESAIAPSAAQIIAGDDENDVPAGASPTLAISTTGAKTFDITGLTSEDTYYGYIVHVDARGNTSAVFECGSFTTDAAATFAAGINFRATSDGGGGVTDGADETYCLLDAYPTTRGGFTFGWDDLSSMLSRDRNSSTDRRLTGILFAQSTTIKTFTLDLPSTGMTLDIYLALGDYSFAQVNNHSLLDDAALIQAYTGSPGTTDWEDAGGTVRTSAAAWAADNVPIRHTFVSDKLRIVLDGTSAARVIAHLSVVQV